MLCDNIHELETLFPTFVEDALPVSNDRVSSEYLSVMSITYQLPSVVRGNDCMDVYGNKFKRSFAKPVVAAFSIPISADSVRMQCKH